MRSRTEVSPEEVHDSQALAKRIIDLAHDEPPAVLLTAITAALTYYAKGFGMSCEQAVKGLEMFWDDTTKLKDRES